MATSALQALSGGPGWRARPAGLAAGAPLTRIAGPVDALALVAEDLASAERGLRDLVHSDVAAVPQVAGHLVDAGGKRLRPALTALGARALGVEVSPSLMCVGELIHLGSLLHDDVVDDGEIRRGRLAAHRLWGSAVSVLSGDFCLARAVLLAAESGGHVAVTELARAVTAMAEGEVLQLQRAGDLTSDRTAYIEVIERKSAALIAWCAAAAAYAAGDPIAAAALELYGYKVGVAFQITDDVLDYRPGTGKTPGVDLQQRKVTLPLLYAMEADPGLRAVLQVGEPTEAQLGDLLARVEATGALDASLADARALVDDGLDALAALPEGPGRDALAALGRYLVERAR
jgi:octaprenyl-diphosphate synthase